tara:strand:+ start:7535 stop:9523 length:1989 start_codon:yes stop_codon:yes gene_type:complete
MRSSQSRLISFSLSLAINAKNRARARGGPYLDELRGQFIRSAMPDALSRRVLPRLALPEWLHHWALQSPQPPQKASSRVLVVAFGLVRSLPMLETTLASLVRFAPPNATLAVSADVPGHLMASARACLQLHAKLRAVGTILYEAHEAPPTHACGGDARRAMEHRNERQASRLLKSVHWPNAADAADAADAAADVVVVVLWRLDTELVSPIEAPALPSGRVLVPYLQSGGLLNDRYLVATATTARQLIDARHDLLRTECVYGEPALVRLLRALDLEVGFTRTRIVRRRADLWIPDVDSVASLGTVRPRAWMQTANALSPALRCDARRALCTLRPQPPPPPPSASSSTAMANAKTRVFGVHGEVNRCPYFRAWESRCVWKNAEMASPSIKPLPAARPGGSGGGRVLVIGDSMDAQLFAATACHLWSHRERGMRLTLTFQAEWTNRVAALRKRCGKEMQQDCHYESAVLRVGGEDAQRVPFQSLHLCQGDRVRCLDEMGFDPLTDDVVTGADALHGVAHGVPGAMGKDGKPNSSIVAAAARIDLVSVLKRVPPDSLIWREATAQHFRSPGGHWTHGFMMRSNIERLEQRCAYVPFAELKAHAHWNSAIVPLLALHNVRVLKTWSGSARQWYNHVDHGDCTHFCQPSSMLDSWAANLLRMLASLRV